MAASRVAIIMRTKDRPVLLRRALGDVEAQRYTDWSLLIVNDGGDPETVERLVAELNGDAHQRVAVLHHPESVGMEAASNAGLAATDSEFVCVHDDDDTWDPSYLASAVDYLDTHPADAAVIARCEMVFEEIRGSDVTELRREASWPDMKVVTLADLLTINRFVPIQLLYRRSVHDTIGEFRADLHAVGDWEFHLRLAQAFTIGLIDDVLAFWHLRPTTTGPSGNSMNSTDLHRVADLRVRDERLKAYADTNGVGDLLYLSDFLRTEFDKIHARLDRIDRRIDDVERVVRETSIGSAVRRRFRALRRSARRLADS